MITKDSYICDRCEQEFVFEDAYDEFVSGLSGVKYYIIDGWYGEYDGQDMCSCCWDSY